MGVKIFKNVRVLALVFFLEKLHLLSVCWDKNCKCFVFSFDFHPRPPSEVVGIATVITFSRSEVFNYCKAFSSILTPGTFSSIIFIVMNVVLQLWKCTMWIHTYLMVTILICFNISLIKTMFWKKKKNDIIVASWHSWRHLICFLGVIWFWLRPIVLEDNFCGVWCVVSSKNVAKMLDIDWFYIFST